MSNNLDLDQALLSGDEEALNGALDGFDFDGDQFFGDEGGEEQDLAAPQQNDVTPEQSQAPEVIDTTGQIQKALGNDGQQEQQDQSEQSAKEGFKEIDGQLYVAVNAENSEVLSKNGKHAIPYEALQRPREQVQELNTRIQELEQQLGDAKSIEERNALLTKQLESAGITPDKLPDELLQDPNAMQTIIDEIDGPAGQLLAAMLAKVTGGQQAPQQQVEQPQQQQVQQQAQDPLNDPQLAQLKSWMDNDQDRWDTAVVIDRSLMRDPEFAKLSDVDRFVEVQRRVNASFGDPVMETVAKEQQQQQEQQQPTAQNQVPNSPSALAGSSTDTAAAAQEALLNQNPMQLEAAMENMSEADIDALLMSAGDSL